MKNKKILLFINIILIGSIILGFVYGINNSYDLTDYVNSLSSKNNLYLKHLIIIFLFLIFSLSLMGWLFGIIYLSFEGISIGYILSLFIMNYKIKGLLYFIYVFIINKLFFLIIIIYLFYIGIKFTKVGLNNLLNESKDSFASLIKPFIKKYLLIILFLLIYDTFIYFFGNQILKFLI